MADETVDLQKLRELKDRGRTPEQQARYEEVTARNRSMQVNGVPAPASGTFGKPKQK